jgi:hypothetical protein
MAITPAEAIIDVPAELEEALIKLAPALPAWAVTGSFLDRFTTPADIGN